MILCMVKNICSNFCLVGGGFRLPHKVAVGVFVFKGLYFGDGCLREPWVFIVPHNSAPSSKGRPA